jgi:hypothetical protein
MGGQACGMSGVPQLPGSGGPKATTGAGGTVTTGTVDVVVVVVVVEVGDGEQAESVRIAAIQRYCLMVASSVCQRGNQREGLKFLCPDQMIAIQRKVVRWR